MFRFVCEAEAGASTAASSCPASTAAVTSAAGTDKCEAGWVHAGRSCYKRFPDQVAALALNIFFTLTLTPEPGELVRGPGSVPVRAGRPPGLGDQRGGGGGRGGAGHCQHLAGGQGLARGGQLGMDRRYTDCRYIQLGQLRLNPPGLGSKCGKRVERLCDF